MEIVLPSKQEIDAVNNSRQAVIDSMIGNGKFLLIEGPCGVDENRLPKDTEYAGEYASVFHGLNLAASSDELEDSAIIYRHNGRKGRTSTGPTGLIDRPDGAAVYVEQASRLVESGVPLASEIADESDYAISAPRLALAWIGSRNEHDAGPRYLLRPTEEAQEAGNVPVPTFVKNGQDGNTDSMVNTISTLKSEEPVTRTRFTASGLKNETTFANPNVGVILRGNNNQETSDDLEEALLGEYWGAREVLDKEFGVGTVPIVVDLSHRHAAIAGGGEDGQLRVADKLASLMFRSEIPLVGIMAETYILPGKQEPFGTVPGQSRYDAGIGEDSALAMNQKIDGVQVLNRYSMRRLEAAS